MSFSFARSCQGALVFVCLLMTGMGCNFHFREAPSSEAAMQLGPSESGCLNGTSQVIARYLSGEGTAAEISGVWHCLSKSLKLFSERTRGAQEGVYKPEELRGFLEKYFLKNEKISNVMLDEIMELKCTLLGGTKNALTLDELNRTLKLLEILDTQTQSLLPFMPMTPNWAIGQNAATIDAAIAALEKAAQAIASPIQKTGYAYDFGHIENLRREFEKFWGTSSSSGFSLTIQRRMPLLQALKSLFIAPKGEQIGGDEWVTVLTSGARWYGVILKLAHAQMNYESWMTGRGRERLTQAALSALTLIDEAVVRHPGEIIPFEEFDQVVETLADDEIPLWKQVGDAKRCRSLTENFLRPVFQRLLAGADLSTQGRAAPGLTRSAVRKAMDALLLWSEGQHFLEALFQKMEATHGYNGPGRMGYLARDLLAQDVQEVLAGENITPSTLKAAQKIRAIVATERPLFMADDSEISFIAPSGNRRHSFHNLETMNWIHLAVDLLVPAYAEDPVRAATNRGVTEEELYTFFKDIEQIGLAVKFLDPKRDNRQMIATRFQEGNLFTFASDGDDFLSPQEGAQLFAFILSAEHLAIRMHEEITDKCTAGTKPEKDPFGYANVPIKCYREQLYGRAAHFFDRMPEMVDYFNSLNDDDRKDFEKAFEVAARLPKSSELYMNSNDAVGFAGVVQYIEALLARYDTIGARGSLNYAESQDAFPNFRGAIKKVVRAKKLEDKVPDRDLEAVFTFILSRGYTPETLWEEAGYLAWKEKRKLGFHWNFEADRMVLMKIFADLSS